MTVCARHLRPWVLLASTLALTCASREPTAPALPAAAPPESATPSLGNAGPREEMDMAAKSMAAPMRSVAADSAGAPPQEDMKKDAGGEGDQGDEAVVTWRRSVLVPNTARMMVGDDEALPLSATEVHVRVDGFRARVVLDTYFYNDRERQLEGTFQLRLPTGGSPYFFAFGETHWSEPGAVKKQGPGKAQGQGFAPDEIMQTRRETWSAPKQARMVPKEKAALAYTQTVRRRVDPALMEWAGAGVFAARVFPLAPRKVHRIVIGYDVDLQAAGADLEYRLDLPTGGGERSIDLEVVRLAGVEMTVTPTASARTRGDADAYHFDDTKVESVTVRLRRPGAILLAGRDAEAGPLFGASFAPDIPSAAGGGASRAVLLVDVSLSSNPDQLNVWLALARALLDRNHDTLRSFAVLFFNVETFWWREAWSPNTPENVATMLSAAHALALEGATDLGAALREAARPRWLATVANESPWDLFLLSDGAATWGESDAAAMTAQLGKSKVAGLFAYNTGMVGSDPQTLGELARASGGALFSVVGEGEIAKAARAHRARPWQIERIEMDGATDLMLAGRPQTLFPGQRVLLVGRGEPTDGAEVRWVMRDGDATRTIRTKVAHVVPSTLAVRAYGQVAVSQLEELRAQAEKEAIAYGCHFRVTGQACSLLMLESEEDYLRFDIKPESYAAVIRARGASDIVREVLASVGDELADAKKGFLAWLRKLGELSGVTFSLSADLTSVLAQLPRSAFEVRVPALVCKEHGWGKTPATLRQALAKRDLVYDVLVQESERRRQALGGADALRALSSLVENNPGDTVLARDVGFQAISSGIEAQAFHIFRRVAATRPFEPQTYAALANVLEAMGYIDYALAYYEVGLAGQWDSRFGAYRDILTLDYLRFLRRISKGELQTSASDFARRRLEELAKERDVREADVLVSITWNTDGTDVDLHVIEPSGEECYYSHPTTAMGGRLTQDVTQGYGPEMYLLPHAKPGTYQVRVKYFASDQNRTSARTKVYATVYRGWGTKSESRTQKVVTLKYGEEMHDIASIVIGK